MKERIFVRSHDHCEVMVDYDVFSDGEEIIQAYAHWSSLPDIPGVHWLPGRNPVFRYADNPIAVDAFVREHFNLTGED